MKILSVFGDFWDEPIKNDQKIIITDLLGYEKSHASNTSDPYLKLASAHPDVDYKLMIRVDDEAHR